MSTGSGYVRRVRDLHRAVSLGDTAQVRAFAAEGLDLSAAYPATGVTPIGRSAALGNAAMLEVLLDLGADPRIACNDRPVVALCVSGYDEFRDEPGADHEAALRLLLARGASEGLMQPHARGGETPVHELVSRGANPLLGVVRTLCPEALGARNVYGEAVAVTAARQGNHEALEMIAEAAPGTLCARAQDGQPLVVLALLWRRVRGRGSAAALLGVLERFAPAALTMTPAPGGAPGMPLHLAAEDNDAQALAVLLRAGWAADGRDAQGRTALEVALEAGADQAAETLRAVERARVLRRADAEGAPTPERGLPSL